MSILTTCAIGSQVLEQPSIVCTPPVLYDSLSLRMRLSGTSAPEITILRAECLGVQPCCAVCKSNIVVLIIRSRPSIIDPFVGT
ncbi:hypothetical protein [Desulfobulbus oligotrophicus]|uniref:Uncharacterized protein n=1 Tax=Desulfobulbus oligotrophicus TaxID=1909699 RepID=A0A7T5VAY2_9BACT|nr:hypothetical protein [Desulfobulbus oligotrophicus]QQG64543.1 hypothetical protein HP555_01060 [Desulfobulbus oligotrophicus]